MQIQKPRRTSPTALYAAAAAVAVALSACAEEAPAADAPAAPSEAAAPAGDAVYRGAAIARQVCAQCHDIGDGSTPAIYSQAPTFKSVADNPETTAEGLAQWLKSSHPSMPHYVFPENEVADLVAYTLSLKATP